MAWYPLSVRRHRLRAGSRVLILLTALALSGTARAADWSQAQPVTVVASESKFTPNSLAFRRGVAYRLHVENRGREMHEFNAADLRSAVNPSMVVRGGGGMDQWVGDLMLELTVQVQSHEGELVLELSEGKDRFQARFRLDNGQCSLWRINADGLPI